MKDLNFNSIEKVCEWFNSGKGDSYDYFTINGDYAYKNPGIEYGDSNEICLIYVDKDKNIDYIWKNYHTDSDPTYEVERVDRKKIAELTPKYVEYISDSEDGFYGFGDWLDYEVCETKAYWDYRVIEYIGKKLI